MVRFSIIKSARKKDKRKFLIIKNGRIVGRVSQIGLDLRPAKRKRKK